MPTFWIDSSKHYSWLRASNIPFRARQQIFLESGHLPAGFNACPASSAPADIGLAVQLADFCVAPLRDNIRPYSLHEMRAVILGELQQRGFVSRSGEVRLRDAALGMSSFYQGIISSPEIEDSIKCIFTPERHGHLIHPGSNPHHILILLFWLYRNWDAIQHQNTWTKTIYTSAVDEVAIDPPTESKSRPFKNRENHREICAAFTSAHPDASRTDFWKSHPTTCRWLSRHDSKWLNQKIPIQSRKTWKQMSIEITG